MSPVTLKLNRPQEINVGKEEEKKGQEELCGDALELGSRHKVVPVEGVPFLSCTQFLKQRDSLKWL